MQPPAKLKALLNTIATTTNYEYEARLPSFKKSDARFQIAGPEREVAIQSNPNRYAKSFRLHIILS